MKNEQPSLRDRIVVITGASSGAGRAIALEFARTGARLFLGARNEDALAEVAEACIREGALAVAVPTDVQNGDSVRSLADTAIQQGGRIDVWVNNAGVLAAGSFEETPAAVHEGVVRTNLIGYIHGAHAAIGQFRRQGHGVLINNISVGGWFPTPYAAAYTASKFGLRGFGEALKGELSGERDIHVCDLFPAFLDSPGIQHAANYTGRYLKPAPPVYDPRNIARACVRLALHPKETTPVTALSPLLRFVHALAPRLSRNLTAGVIRTYLKNADPLPPTTGNIFAPALFDTGIHGGWSTPAEQGARLRAAAPVLAILGLAAGVWMLARRR